MTSRPFISPQTVNFAYRQCPMTAPQASGSPNRQHFPYRGSQVVRCNQLFLRQPGRREKSMYTEYEQESPSLVEDEIIVRVEPCSTTIHRSSVQSARSPIAKALTFGSGVWKTTTVPVSHAASLLRGTRWTSVSRVQRSLDLTISGFSRVS